jgi:hypothetical protein
MPSVLEYIQHIFTPVKPLQSGIYHYQAPPDAPVPYRLHLRLEPDGNGLLLVNASTILHLNPTAAEYAFHLVNQTTEEQMLRSIKDRYRVSRQQAISDFQNLKERIVSLTHSTDLDPEMFLDFERSAPYTEKISAPYRLDCAVTYNLSYVSDDFLAPNKNVLREMTTEEWNNVFDKAWKFGIPHIILTGGEPTLREDLAELISHTETNGQIVGLLTDGLRFLDADYLNSLLQTGLDHIMLSINPDSIDSWKALENVVSADVFVAVHHTLTLHNLMDTTQTLEHISKLGIKSISLSASDPALQESLKNVRNQAAEYGLSLVWDLPVPYSAFNPVALETQVDQPASGAGHAWLYIEPDGDVLPSQGSVQVLGNILRDPWEALWR